MDESSKKHEALLERLKRRYDFFDVRRSTLPAKQYFLLPVETTFTVEPGSSRPQVPPAPNPFVLYGLSIAELQAIRYLDEIMSSPEKDFYYFRRREMAILVGLAEDDDGAHGADIIVLESHGKATAHTRKGAAMLKGFNFDKEIGARKRPGKGRADKKVMPRLKGLLADAELLKDAVEWSWSGYEQIWERLGAECMGCGICTYVCPLCHCFSVDDKIGLDKQTSRCRGWTACTLPEFSLVAGGHHFHPTIKERYYNWFFHKFVRAYAEFGRSQCIACGSCQRECPARIDIEAVLVEIVGAYKGRAK